MASAKAVAAKARVVKAKALLLCLPQLPQLLPQPIPQLQRQGQLPPVETLEATVATVILSSTLTPFRLALRPMDKMLAALHLDKLHPTRK